MLMLKLHVAAYILFFKIIFDLLIYSVISVHTGAEDFGSMMKNHESKETSDDKPPVFGSTGNQEVQTENIPSNIFSEVTTLHHLFNLIFINLTI